MKKLIRRRYTAPMILLGLFFSSTFAQVRVDTWITVGPADSLDATYYTPSTPPPAAGYPALLFVHGFGQTKDDEIPSCEVYARLGYVAFTYSVRGHGNSTGLSTIMSVQEGRDLDTAVHFLKALPIVDTNAIGVSGGSQGGLHALWAAINHPEVRAVSANVIVPHWASDMLSHGSARRTIMLLLRSPFVRYAPVRDTLWNLLSTGQYDSLRIRFGAGRDIDTAALNRSRTPLSILLKWQDHYFTPEDGIATFQQYPWEKKLYVGTGGHFSDGSDSEYLVQYEQVSRWFGHYLKHDSLGNPCNTPVIAGFSSLPMDSAGRFAWAHGPRDTWPPTSAEPFRFYLAPDSLLQLWAPGPKQDSVVLVNDFRDTSYTFEMGYWENFSGPHFDNSLPRKALVFVSDPLPRELSWQGMPRLKLKVRSAFAAFPIHAQIYEVDAAGAKYFINRIPCTINNWVPGSSGTIEVNGISHAHRFSKGSRIRVEITNVDANNRPVWGIYPFSIPLLASASVTVYAGGPDPSYIELPLEGVPAGLPLAGLTQPIVPVLFQNYPNPFNPWTVIRGEWSVASDVRLVVYDVLGREVAVLADGRFPAGSHEFTFDASGFPSGVYFYRLMNRGAGGNGGEARKMILLR